MPSESGAAELNTANHDSPSAPNAFTLDAPQGLAGGTLVSALKGISVSKYRRAFVLSVACLALASCSTSATVSPPAAAPTTSTKRPAPSSVAPPAPHVSPLAKDWKSYGGTVYFGCPNEFSTSKSALEDIRPKVLDTKTADLIAPAVPAIPVGETVTGAMCALTNIVGDIKVVYVVTTSAPGTAPEAAKTTAYVFDLKSNQPLATKEIKPPTPEVKLGAANQWRVSPTPVGVAWVNAFTDPRGAASPPRTVMLSNTDLVTMWDDPQPGQVWQDVLSFQRSTVPANTFGAELRLPTGEPVFQDNDISTVDGELFDGPDRLVKLTRWDSHTPPVLSTMFFDLNSRALIKIGDSEKVSGGGLAATLSDGKLFIDGRGSNTSQFGFGVWNLRSQQWDLLRDREEAKKLPIVKMAFFGDHLYVTNTGNTYSVLALPATNPIATNWSGRPFGRISGWTLVCRGETEASQAGECREILLVQDAEGRYPGPWF